MFNCIGAPMFGSQPHFYGCDQEQVEKFASGINPTKEEHAIFMHFETVRKKFQMKISDFQF